MGVFTVIGIITVSTLAGTTVSMICLWLFEKLCKKGSD